MHPKIEQMHLNMKSCIKKGQSFATIGQVLFPKHFIARQLKISLNALHFRASIA